jgi:hypothetical protein
MLVLISYKHTHRCEDYTTAYLTQSYLFNIYTNDYRFKYKLPAAERSLLDYASFFGAIASRRGAH